MATEEKRYIHVVGTTTELTTANDLMFTGELWYDKTLGKFKFASADGNYNSQAFYIHAWADISGKPSSYPSTIADVTGLTAALAGKLDTSYTPTWTSISGKPSSFPSAIADVTGLTSALAGKAASTHTHAWGDITGVPAASADTPGVVRVGSGLAISGGILSATGGGGGGGGWSPGFLFDPREAIYRGGMGTGTAAARQNTLAIQAAVDAAAVSSGGHGNGTVVLPSVIRGYDSYIYLESPFWLNCDNTLITGAVSKESTVIYSKGPAICMAKHPRYWEMERKILTDKATGTKYIARQYENTLKNSELTSANPTLEVGQIVYIRHESNGSLTGEYKTGPGAYNSLAMSTGASVFPTPELAYFSRYKVDLRKLRTGQQFPPGSQPEFEPLSTMTDGQSFGLRCWSGAIAGEMWSHPIAFGDTNQTGQWASRWSDKDVACWEAVIQHVTPVWWGGIFGVGSENDPDPFILFGAGNSIPAPPAAPTEGTYYFDLALTDPGTVRRTWLRFTFAQNATAGLHRIAIQYNPAAAEADRLVVFLDRVRVAVTVSNLTGSYPGYDGNSGRIEPTNLIAPWRSSQLSVLKEHNSAAGFTKGLQHQYLHYSDGIFVAASVRRKLVYTTPAIGQPQVKIAGGGADDSSVWGPSTPNDEADVLGFVHFSYEFSPDNEPTLANLLGSNRKIGARQAGGMGTFGPRGGAHGLAQAPSGNTIANLTLGRFEGWSNGSSIHLYSYINTTTIRDCNLAHQGYFFAIAASTTVASYYLYLEDCNLGRGLHLSNATVRARNLHFTYIVNSFVRLVGCRFKLKTMTSAAVESRDEAAFVIIAGDSIGSGCYLEDVTLNFEGLPRQPRTALIFVERAYATAGDGLWVKDSVFGEFACPLLHLVDYVGSAADERRSTIELINVGFSTPSETVIVQGKQFQTGERMIEVDLAAYTSSDLVKYVNARDGANFNNITTVMRNGFGIPQCGTFIPDSHIVEIRRPVPGGPTGWTCGNASDTIGKSEGTDDTPFWRTIGRAPSRNSSSLSANFFPGLHFGFSFTHNGTKTAKFSGVTQAFSRRLLSKLLHATALAAPSQFYVNWGFYNTYLETANYDPGFFATGTLSLSTYFGTPAASGEKLNTTAISVNGSQNVPAWDVGLTRPACGMCHIVPAAGTTPKDGAFAFLTSPWAPIDWQITLATVRTIAIGGMKFKRTNRGSGFTDWTSNRMIDWMTGVSWTPPSTLFFGLSTTEPNQATGANVTEPSGGSYARVQVTSNVTNWGEIRDSSFYGNRTAITFNQPTGDWGEPPYVVVYDALTGGNCVGVAPINFPARITAASRPPTFEPGAIVFQV